MPTLLETTYRFTSKIVIALGIVAAAPLPAHAQVSNSVDSSLLESWRLTTGNTIRFCQYDASPTFAFDRAIAEALAQQLLVNAEYTSLGANYGIGGEFAAEDLFVNLTNDCDVMLGMGLAPEMYPVEFIATRPYASFSYVLAVADQQIERLGDIAGGDRIGAMVGSFGFVAIHRYVATLPASARLTVLPYGNTDLMVTRLLDGTISGMVVYGPSFVQYQSENPVAGEIEIRPLDAQIAADIYIGGLLLARNTYLRTMLDEAIALMIDDGTIELLVAESGLDGIPHTAGGTN